MTITGRVWTTFDRRCWRHRIRAWIALRSERSEVDRNGCLIAGDDDVRNAVGRAVPDSAEVRMKTRRESHTGDEVVGIRIDGSIGNVFVPRVVGREELFTMQARARAEIRRWLRRHD